MKKLQIALLAAGLVIAAQARATLYNLTYTDGGANVANGQLDVDLVNGVATSGFLNVSAGIAAGSWTLANASAGDFAVDNKVFPGATPFLTTTGGLLFKNGAVELNIWAGDGSWNVPAGQYGFWANIGGAYNPQSAGQATLAAVPEPATVFAGALLLLPFGASMLRVLRRKA